MAQALALAFRPRYANGHAVRTTLGDNDITLREGLISLNKTV
ncbi:hypothetical protein [Moorena sp. SIO3B2]|nr:hypothetical protein [Moorena sp. SIO3B2]